MIDPEQQRRFALDVVCQLRTAGFEAYWAGGCVRDELLGRTPKDYDVATSATPPEIRALFGDRRTLPLGAAFGVITVLGPRPAGMIEVATFRQDADYSDGRHPDHVTFSSAREDAARRDFTINGMFFDPVDRQGDRLRRRAGRLAKPPDPGDRSAAIAVWRRQAADAPRSVSPPHLIFPSMRQQPPRSARWPARLRSSAPSGSPWKCAAC